MSDSSSSGWSAGGIIGSILACVLSYSVNQSVLWAILHFFCSWLYVLYWIFAKSTIIEKHISPLLK